MLKKSLVIFTFLICFNLIQVYADDTKYFNEYQKLKSEGILGCDVSYKDFVDLKERMDNQKIEIELQKNKSFKKIMNITPYYIYIPDDILKPGDVILTNGVGSSNGLLGHAGIAVSRSSVFHIAGKGYKPASTYFPTFVSDYTSRPGSFVEIFRHKNLSVASSAANWVYRKYNNKNPKYAITRDASTTHETYCSKMVWQGYRYGVGKSAVINYNHLRYVLPFDLDDDIKDLYSYETF